MVDIARNPKPITTSDTITTTESVGYAFSGVNGWYLDHTVYVNVTTACTVSLVDAVTGKVLIQGRAALNGQCVLRFIDSNGEKPTSIKIVLSVLSPSTYYTLITVRGQIVKSSKEK